MLEKVVKEAIYVASALYQHPYEKGKLEGKSELVLKQLAKKFGFLPPEIRQKIAAAEPHQRELIAEGIFDFRDLGDVLRCLA
jgi:hypothetical protein